MGELPDRIVVAHGIDQHPDGGHDGPKTGYPPNGYFASYYGPNPAGRPRVGIYNLDTMMAPVELTLDRAPYSGDEIELVDGEHWRVVGDPLPVLVSVGLPAVEWQRIVEKLEGSADADLRTSACLIALALEGQHG